MLYATIVEHTSGRHIYTLVELLNCHTNEQRAMCLSFDCLSSTPTATSSIIAVYDSRARSERVSHRTGRVYIKDISNIDKKT